MELIRDVKRIDTSKDLERSPTFEVTLAGNSRIMGKVAVSIWLGQAHIKHEYYVPDVASPYRTKTINLDLQVNGYAVEADVSFELPSGELVRQVSERFRRPSNYDTHTGYTRPIMTSAGYNAIRDYLITDGKFLAEFITKVGIRPFIEADIIDYNGSINRKLDEIAEKEKELKALKKELAGSKRKVKSAQLKIEKLNKQEIPC